MTLAAGTKPYGFLGAFPGPGVGGHCIPCDPHYLLWQLDSKAAPAPLIKQAMRSIAERPHRVADRAAELLTAGGVAVAGRQGDRGRRRLQGRRPGPARVPRPAADGRPPPPWAQRSPTTIRWSRWCGWHDGQTVASVTGPGRRRLRPGHHPHAAPGRGLRVGGGVPPGARRHLPVRQRAAPRGRLGGRNERRCRRPPSGHHHAGGHPQVRPERHAPRRSRRDPEPRAPRRPRLRGTRGTLGPRGRLPLPPRPVDLAPGRGRRGAHASPGCSRWPSGSGARPCSFPRTTPGPSSWPSTAARCGRRSCSRRPPPGLPRQVAGKFSMHELCQEAGVPCPPVTMPAVTGRGT